MKSVFAIRGRCGRNVHFIVLGAAGLLLAACANNPNSQVSGRSESGDSVVEKTPGKSQAAKPRTAKSQDRPHTVIAAAGHAPDAGRFSTVGLASWYGAGFHGRRTADGEIFDMNSLTAAHPSLPLPSDVRVTNLANNRSLVVRVNDRGPFVGSRAIDVSARTARLLGFYERGLARVKIDYLGRAAAPAGEKVTASAVPP